MPVVKSIFAGVAAVLGFILLLLLLPALIHHIEFPILRFMRYHGGNRANSFFISFHIPHVGWIAGIVFLVGFGLVYWHAKSERSLEGQESLSPDSLGAR